MYEDEDNAAHVERNQNAIYKRNQQKKAAFLVDSKTRAKVIQSWPLVTMNLHALKDKDIPFGIKVGHLVFLRLGGSSVPCLCLPRNVYIRPPRKVTVFVRDYI